MRIVEIGGKKIAAYRSEKGTTTLLSPVSVLTDLHAVTAPGRQEWTPRNSGDDSPESATLREALGHAVRDPKDSAVPVRQNRRSVLIEAALKPVRNQFRAGPIDTLSKALALIIGTEGMIAIKDVLQLDDKEARKMKRWAIRALVEAVERHVQRSAQKQRLIRDRRQ